MPTVTFLPDQRSVEVEAGTTLLQAAKLGMERALGQGREGQA